MKTKAVPWTLIVILVGVGLFAFHRLFHILIPFVLSFAFAYIINPLIANFEARGWRREATVLAFYLFSALTAVLLAGGTISLLSDELQSLQQELPANIEKARHLPVVLQGKLARHWPGGADLISRWDATASTAHLVHEAQNIPGYLLSLAPLLSLLF